MVHERHHRLRTLRLPYVHVLTFGQLTLYHLGIVVIQWSWNELSAYPCMRYTQRISSGSPVPDRPTAISDHFIHRTYRSYSSCRYRSFGIHPIDHVQELIVLRRRLHPVLAEVHSLDRIHVLTQVVPHLLQTSHPLGDVIDLL